MNTSPDYSNNQASYLIDSTIRIEIHLSTTKRLLSERLTRLYRRAELDLIQNTIIESGSNNRASIYLAAQNIAINIFKLENEGLRILANGQARQMRGLPTYAERRSIDPKSVQKGIETEKVVDSNQNTEYDESEIY